MPKTRFNNNPNPFFLALKKKVDAFFESRKISSTGNESLFFKNVFLLGGLRVIYIIIVFFTPHVIISILLCTLLGIDFALIGFNIMHEGGHQSISKNKWLNTISSYSL